MTLEVDYLPNSTGVGAEVMSQANYASAAPNGVSNGLADPTFMNKTVRQSSVMTAALANLISATLGINVQDDGNVSALQAFILETIQAIAVTGSPPTRTVINSGSGNYSVPANCVRLHVRMSGGGGGGGGGGAGGTTTFNSIGANPGATSSGVTGGAGGTGGAGSPTNVLRVPGGAGLNATSISVTGSVQPSPAPGGTGPFGSGGPGAGGPGSYSTLSSTASAAGGGGAGEWVEFDVHAPVGPYAYAVGAAGTAGASSTAGKAGIIVIDEYYA